jgi:hypothetical protein
MKEKPRKHSLRISFLSQITQMTQIVLLTNNLKTGCAYLRDPRDLREIITPARNNSLCALLVTRFFGPRGPRFFLDEKGGPVGVMVSALDCCELARKQAGR